MRQRLIPAQEARVEITVANSRFIATVAPVFTVDEAKALVTRIKREFPDATHHVPAYLIGHGATVVAHCRDDGEPSGTAGRPALAVLRGSGLGDVAVVVTRYFGGTKLGTGGLVRAYGDAVREVLSALPRATKTLTHTVDLVMPYSYFERIRRLVTSHRGNILREDFAVQVTITARFAVEHLPAFQDALLEISSGRVKVEMTEANRTTIMPVAVESSGCQETRGCLPLALHAAWHYTPGKVSERNVMPDLETRHAVERILEDESLAADLTDDAARILLDWGIARIKSLPPEKLEPVLADLRCAMKHVNREASKAATDVQTERVRALLAEIETEQTSEADNGA